MGPDPGSGSGLGGGRGRWIIEVRSVAVHVHGWIPRIIVSTSGPSGFLNASAGLLHSSPFSALFGGLYYPLTRPVATFFFRCGLSPLPLSVNTLVLLCTYHFTDPKLAWTGKGKKPPVTGATGRGGWDYYVPCSVKYKNVTATHTHTHTPAVHVAL